MEYHGEVDYYTHPDNVKIFGFMPYCGDGLISGVEQCDFALAITNETCANHINCTGGYYVSGNLSCSGGCSINSSSCSCAPDYMSGTTYNSQE